MGLEAGGGVEEVVVVVDDGEYYSILPADALVKQDRGLGLSLHPDISLLAELDTPGSSLSAGGIARAEKAPAVDAQPVVIFTSRVSSPPPNELAGDTAVETAGDPTFNFGFSLLQDRSWLALTVKEATRALASTAPLASAHPHHAANMFILSQVLHVHYSHTKDPKCLALALQLYSPSELSGS